jgi:hypothetical protein
MPNPYQGRRSQAWIDRQRRNWAREALLGTASHWWMGFCFASNPCCSMTSRGAAEVGRAARNRSLGADRGTWFSILSVRTGPHNALSALSPAAASVLVPLLSSSFQRCPLCEPQKCHGAADG